MLENEFGEYEANSKKVVESLRRQIATIRTGRATPALIEDAQVDAYGDKLPVRQLASVNVPEIRMIVIQPYDNSTLKAIEKAIQRSDLGYTVDNDGRLIRVTFQRLTEEMRRELAKQLLLRCNEARASLRNVRRDFNDFLRKLESDHVIAEVEYRSALERSMSIVDRYIREVDACWQAKQNEILDLS